MQRALHLARFKNPCRRIPSHPNCRQKCSGKLATRMRALHRRDGARDERESLGRLSQHQCLSLPHRAMAFLPQSTTCIAMPTVSICGPMAIWACEVRPAGKASQHVSPAHCTDTCTMVLPGTLGGASSTLGNKSYFHRRAKSLLDVAQMA